MGSDAPAVGSNESMYDVVNGLTLTLPDFMKVQNEQVLPQALAQLNAAKTISPEYNDLTTELARKYLPQLAEIGSGVENINRTNAAKTDLDILKGSGGELVKEAQGLDKQLNPEYYNTRAAAGDKLGQLLGSINLNDANPEAERLVNQENIRSGNLNNSSSTNTVSNALSFGSELDKRRNSLGQALSVATNFLQPSQSAFNPVVTALNRPSTNNGQSQFSGVNQPGSQAYQSGQNLLNNSTQMKMQQNDINANRRDGLDRFNETLSGIGSIVSV